MNVFLKKTYYDDFEPQMKHLITSVCGGSDQVTLNSTTYLRFTASQSEFEQTPLKFLEIHTQDGGDTIVSSGTYTYNDVQKYTDCDGYLWIKENINGSTPDDPQMYRIEEAVNSSITLVGETTNCTNPDKSSAIWRISRIARLGNKTYTEFVSDGGFNQIWNNRENLFDSLFDNTYSLQFDGVSKIKVDNDTSIDFSHTDPISFSCWFKTKGGQQRFLDKTGTGSAATCGYRFEILATGAVRAEFRVADSNRVRITCNCTDHADGAWHHLCITKDNTSNGSGVKIYLDGSLDTSTINNDTLTSTITNTGDLYVGASKNGGTPRFKGNIDEVALFDTELTSTDVTNLYNNGVPDDLNDHAKFSNCVMWFSFNDTEDFPTENDLAGSNNGTLDGHTIGDYETETPG